MEMYAVLAWLILASGCVGGDEKAVPPADDTGRPDSDTDTGAPPDTGSPDSVDTETGDTDTGESGDTDTDTGSADSGICDPAPYLTRDTGDTGQPPDVPFEEPDTAVDTAYRTEDVDDCDVSVVSEAGHPLLGCFGTTFDMTTGRTLADWPYNLDQGEWLGDLDGDGYDDLLMRTWAGHDPASATQYILYGGPDVLDRGRDLSPDTVAQAWTTTDEQRPVMGGGDFNGDGTTDLIIASDAVGAESAEVGILFGTGDRFNGALTSWGTGAFWQKSDNDDEASWPGFQQQGNGGNAVAFRRAIADDMDGDGLTDLVFSAAWPYFDPRADRTESGISIVRGSASLAPGGALRDSATWIFESLPPCEDPATHVTYACWLPRGTPIGDVNGDGDQELGILSFPAMESAGSEKRYDIVDVGDLAPCNYESSSVYDARLTAPELDVWSGSHDMGYEHVGLTDLMAPAGDLNGDGLDDFVVGVVRGTITDTAESLYFVYGGEEWQRFGGSLYGDADRLDVDWQGGNQLPSPTSVTFADLSGEGTSSMILGTTYDPASGYEPPDSRSVAEIYSPPTGGFRGVLSKMDLTLALVSPNGAGWTLPNIGTGDADGDGKHDLYLSDLNWYWTYDRYGNPVDSYPVWAGSLATGAELSTYLP